MPALPSTADGALPAGAAGPNVHVYDADALYTFGMAADGATIYAPSYSSMTVAKYTATALPLNVGGELGGG